MNKEQRKARWASRFHYAMTGVWALLLVPTLLFWSQSVLWVAFMSLYANAASHISAAKASKAQEEAAN